MNRIYLNNIQAGIEVSQPTWRENHILYFQILLRVTYTIFSPPTPLVIYNT